MSCQSSDPRFEIALSQYSLRELLSNGSLRALDFPAFTADTFDIKAIDLWEGGLPQDRLDDASYLFQLKSRADQAGTDLFLLMGDTYDCSAESRSESLRGILKSLDRAALLECQYLRVFLRVPGEDDATGTAVCIEALEPLLEAAAEKKITIAIEPGNSLLTTRGSFLAKVADRLQHPAFTLMPDFGKLVDNVYDGTAAMLPYSGTISCKMLDFDGEGNQPGFDYPRLMKMISESDYSGYLAIECEGGGLRPVEAVQASQELIQRSLSALH